MTLIEAVRSILVKGKIKNVFIVDAPVPGECVLITPYASQTHEGAEVSENKFQIKCAAASFIQSEDLAWKVFDLLEGKYVPSCDRVTLGSVYSLQEPFFIGKDENNRYIQAFNIAVNAVWKER